MLIFLQKRRIDIRQISLKKMKTYLIIEKSLLLGIVWSMES